jgi:rhodanese-related sulfurtransferase
VYISVVILALAVVTSAFVYFQKQKAQRRRAEIHISVEELKRQVDADTHLTIVDLRHPLDVLSSPQAIPGAISVPAGELDQHVADISRNQKVILYCTCPNEETSLRAYEQMKQRGFRRVKVLTGGLPAWKKAGFAVKELYVMPQERAKQVAAG